jgi:exosortase
MMESPNPPPPPAKDKRGLPAWVGPALCGLIVAVFYFVVAGFGNAGTHTPANWLQSTWNHENDFEHGFMVPVIIVGLIAWQWKNLRKLAENARGMNIGLPVAVLGIAFFVIAHRCGQPRLAIGGLPMILWGSSLYLWGWQAARALFFPLFFLWIAIPVPQFQQATTKLQILSTHMAQWGSNLFGIETVVRGTQIYSAHDAWKPLEINEGCGGIRSLMALIMISAVWSYLAKVSLWKKAILLLSAFPLAILGNMMRLTSIFVISEYGNAEFAANTWHDWSGLLIFYPISLLLLLLVHSALEQGLPWKRPRKRQVRRVVGNPEPEAPSVPVP